MCLTPDGRFTWWNALSVSKAERGLGNECCSATAPCHAIHVAHTSQGGYRPWDAPRSSSKPMNPFASLASLSPRTLILFAAPTPSSARNAARAPRKRAPNERIEATRRLAQPRRAFEAVQRNVRCLRQLIPLHDGNNSHNNKIHLLSVYPLLASPPAVLFIIRRETRMKMKRAKPFVFRLALSACSANSSALSARAAADNSLIRVASNGNSH